MNFNSQLFIKRSMKVVIPSRTKDKGVDMENFFLLTKDLVFVMADGYIPKEKFFNSTFQYTICEHFLVCYQ